MPRHDARETAKARVTWWRHQAGAFGLLGLAMFGLCECAGRKKSDEDGQRSAPVVVVTGQRLQVGFDAQVELKAEVRGGNPSEWVLGWKHVWGAEPREMHVEGGSLRFRTIQAPSLEQAKKYAGRMVAISAQEAGREVFVAEATSPGGRKLQRFVEVFPALPSPSWTRLPPNMEGYFFSPEEATYEFGAKNPSYRFTRTSVPYLTRMQGPPPGWFTLKHPSGSSETLRSGAWLGMTDCGRSDCHPIEQRGWSETKHATIFRRGISGELPSTKGPYQEHCVACHTLGYQPGAENDGFDDRARRARWDFPERPSPAAWATMPSSVKERANVQCEHCHGPGWFWVGYGSDVCAQCHDHPPEYRIPAQARRNKMSRSQESVAGTTLGPACEKCHVASAFLEAVKGHSSKSKPGTELDVQPAGVGCPVCHDPHGVGCARQLRFCGEVETPGLTFTAGQGALCIVCHSDELDIFSGGFLTPFLPGQDRHGMGHSRDQSQYVKDPYVAPHAPQLLVLTGRGGRFLTVPSTPPTTRTLFPHMWVPESCVGCHNSQGSKATMEGGHSFRLRPDVRSDKTVCASEVDLSGIRDSKMTFPCETCHGKQETLNVRALGDYDGNGTVDGIVDEVEALLKMLKAEIEEEIRRGGYQSASGVAGATFAIASERIVVADSQCAPLLDAKGEYVHLGPQSAPLSKAAFNFLMIARDRSAGIHNPQYSIRLLQDGIESLEKGRGQAKPHYWRRLTP